MTKPLVSRSLFQRVCPKLLLLDDNDSFLRIAKPRIGDTICTLNKTSDSIISHVKTIEGQFNCLVVSANLRLSVKDKRSDRIGLRLLQNLSYQVFNKTFVVVSFEKESRIRSMNMNANHLLSSDDVLFLDVIEFMRAISR